MVNNRVFIGLPWTSSVNTWPGIISDNGKTVSNYFAFPLSIIDPPTPSYYTPGGTSFRGGSKSLRKRNMSFHKGGKSFRKGKKWFKKTKKRR